MVKKQQDEIFEDENEEIEGISSVWDLLTPQQKRYFKKLSEKTPDKMNYIG